MALRDARPEAAEFAGTFLLVSLGAGAAAAGRVEEVVGPGIVVLLCVYALGRYSGAHFNPAVTIAFVAAREFPLRRAVSYVAVQVAGALAGAAVFAFSFPSSAPALLTRTGLDPVTAFGVEAAVTFILMTTIMAAATDSRMPRWLSGASIGGAVALCVAIAGPLTGGSMNPARSLGPAVLLGRPEDIWLYLTAPFVGAALASLTYARMRGPEFRREGARGEVGRHG